MATKTLSITFIKKTSTDDYRCTKPAPRKQLPLPREYLSRRIKQSSCSARPVRLSTFAPTQRTYHRATVPNFLYPQLTNYLQINTEIGVHVPQGINSIANAPGRTLIPTAVNLQLDS